ncbi:hypothetical protein HPB48_002091 [Haemaphysalis longicornis]|uniref:Uncharacterized protein n=1 Tax=Haemaphysalis longicornis TaxID=44386 RepID=A0A9J6FIE8_HAELO|nr:hypothetical protein HPB48_002091 [Haemaphysalis longicornis]
MTYARGHLVTGGVDTYLVLSTRISVVKHAPLQVLVWHVWKSAAYFISLCPCWRLSMSLFNLVRYLCARWCSWRRPASTCWSCTTRSWRCGAWAHPQFEEAPTGTRLPLAVKPVMVARVVARTNGRFEAAALSDDGVWLSCTDAISSLLYHIEHVSAYVYSVAAGLTAVQKLKCC